MQFPHNQEEIKESSQRRGRRSQRVPRYSFVDRNGFKTPQHIDRRGNLIEIVNGNQFRIHRRHIQMKQLRHSLSHSYGTAPRSSVTIEDMGYWEKVRSYHMRHIPRMVALQKVARRNHTWLNESGTGCRCVVADLPCPYAPPTIEEEFVSAVKEAAGSSEKALEDAAEMPIRRKLVSFVCSKLRMFEYARAFGELDTIDTEALAREYEATYGGQPQHDQQESAEDNDTVRAAYLEALRDDDEEDQQNDSRQ